MSKPIVSVTTPSGPIVDPQTGQPTFAFMKWLQGIGNTINQAFDTQTMLSPDSVPFPTEDALGGVITAGPVTSEWINQIDSKGVPHLSQPGFADLIGSVTSAQLPVATTSLRGAVKPDGTTITVDSTGIITALGPINEPDVAHEWLNSYNSATRMFAQSQPAAADLSNGTTGTGSVVLSASPTITGTLTADKFLSPSSSGVALTIGISGTPTTTSSTILLNNGLPSNGIEFASSAGGGGFIQGGPQILNFFTFTGAVGSEAFTQRATITSSGMAVTGTFTATTKNFTIPYPGDPTRLLVHSVTEGPEISVFYRGTGQLVNGIATITLPDYFEALTLADGRTVLLTPQFASATDPISQLAASVVANGEFSVRASDTNNPAQTFCWEVKAVRSDQPVLQVVLPAPTESTSPNGIPTAEVTKND